MLDINFNFINQKLSSGYKLRFDIGTSYNIPYSLEWLREDEKIFVIAIEPHPKNFESSKKIIKDFGYNDRCYLIEAAVDDVNSIAKKVFYGLGGKETNYDSGTSSLRKPMGRFKDCIEQIYNVNVVSLKTILDNLEYDFIDHLKVDTQGNDLNVLKSLGDHIKKVIEIQSEYDSTGEYQFANSGKELDDFLIQNHFEKCEPILCYWTDENGNCMYDVSDYKYKNINFHRFN